MNARADAGYISFVRMALGLEQGCPVTWEIWWAAGQGRFRFNVVCMNVLSAHRPAYHLLAWCLWRPAEGYRVPKKEVRMVMNHHVGAGTLCKSNKYSYCWVISILWDPGFFFNYFLFYTYKCFVCVYVCAPCTCPMPAEIRSH